MTDKATGNAESTSLPPLTDEVALGLANKIASTLHEACKAIGKPASSEAKKLVAQRVHPNSLSKYELIEAYPVVIVDEMMMIFDRILAYPTTAIYREHLQAAPPEVIKAWQIHSQSLRAGELYIIQDRTTALLKFLYQVAIDIGIPAISHAKPFESKFKKTFKRRLRERHRLVHAHERPSLESRVISLGGVIARVEPNETARILTDLFTNVVPQLSQMMAETNRELPLVQEDFEILHETAAVTEAAEMLNLVGDALLRTLNLLPKAGD